MSDSKETTTVPLWQVFEFIQQGVMTFSCLLNRINYSIISINRGRLGRGAEDVSLKNQELMS